MTPAEQKYIETFEVMSDDMVTDYMRAEDIKQLCSIIREQEKRIEELEATVWRRKACSEEYKRERDALRERLKNVEELYARETWERR